MKVLIYGFGWSGKATLELCENMGCECCVIDDAMDAVMLDNTRFISYAMLEEKVRDSKGFDVYWIAVNGKPEVTQKIKQKLLLCGGGA